MTKKLKHDDANWFDALKWRCIGPPRGGRVVAVAGDPNDTMTSVSYTHLTLPTIYSV